VSDSTAADPYPHAEGIIPSIDCGEAEALQVSNFHLTCAADRNIERLEKVHACAIEI